MNTFSAIALTAVVASVSADVYTWQGSSISFDNDALWQGGNPNSADVPSSTELGSSQSKTTTIVPVGQYNVGSKIVLNGAVKLFLGTGAPGDRTKLTFGSNNGGQVAVFDPQGSSSDPKDAVAGGFDYNCNLNWKVGDVVPADPPCRKDDVQFQPGGAYYATTFNKAGGAKFITVLGSTAKINACPDTSQGPTFVVDGAVTVSIQNCDSKFGFKEKKPTQGPSNWECPTTTCAADLETVDDNGNTIKIYTTGSNAGKGFQVDEDGTLVPVILKNTTDSDGNQIYQYGSIKVSPDGEQITTTPSPTTPSPTTVDPDLLAASSGDADSAVMTTIVIIVVIVALIIIVAVVVVVVVVKKKAGSSATDDRNIVSFENPMYDDVAGTTANMPSSNAPDDGLYDDPEISTGATTGYMDVPGGNDNAIGGSGYMDVAPGNNDDYDDDDSEDDNEDI